MNEYFKIVHHPNTIEELRKGEQPNPILVQIILSDLCNQDCHFCAYRTSGYSSNQLFNIGDNHNPNRMLDTFKVFSILDDCKELGVKAVEFTGGGEPLVHLDSHHIFEYALEKNLEIALTSNGVLLNDKHIPALLNATWVRFSIDAGSADTYNKIRKSNAYIKVLYNIGKFIERSPKGTVGISFVVLEDNYKELLNAVRVAKSLGVNYIRLGAVYTDKNAYINIQEQISSLIAMAKSEETERFKVYDQFTTRLKNLSSDPDYEFCGHQHINTYIAGDGNVYRCCTLAYNERGLIGSLKDKSFKELWLSQEKKDNLSNFNATNCTQCPFNDKNKFINYILNKESGHINYV